MAVRSRLVLMCTALLAIVAGACESMPATYADCLLSYASDSFPDEARRLCREIFPPDTPFYQGNWYYATEGATQCSDLAFDSAGNFLTYTSGICGDGSKIECTEDDCFFTCRDYANRDSTAIWLISERTGEEFQDEMPGAALELRRREARLEGGFRGNRVDSVMWLKGERVSTFYSSVASCETRLKNHRREQSASDTVSED